VAELFQELARAHGKEEEIKSITSAEMSQRQAGARQLMYLMGT
jgi:hypothetical protein